MPHDRTLSGWASSRTLGLAYLPVYNMFAHQFGVQR